MSSVVCIVCQLHSDSNLLHISQLHCEKIYILPKVNFCWRHTTLLHTSVERQHSYYTRHTYSWNGNKSTAGWLGSKHQLTNKSTAHMFWTENPLLDTSVEQATLYWTLLLDRQHSTGHFCWTGNTLLDTSVGQATLYWTLLLDRQHFTGHFCWTGNTPLDTPVEQATLYWTLLLDRQHSTAHFCWTGNT